MNSRAILLNGFFNLERETFFSLTKFADKVLLTWAFSYKESARLAYAMYDRIHGLENKNSDIKAEQQLDFSEAAPGDAEIHPNSFETWEEFQHFLNEGLSDGTNDWPDGNQEIFLGDGSIFTDFFFPEYAFDEKAQIDMVQKDLLKTLGPNYENWIDPHDPLVRIDPDPEDYPDLRPRENPTDGLDHPAWVSDLGYSIYHNVRLGRWNVPERLGVHSPIRFAPNSSDPFWPALGWPGGQLNDVFMLRGTLFISGSVGEACDIIGANKLTTTRCVEELGRYEVILIKS